MRDVALALEDRQRKTSGAIGRNDYSDEAISKIARWMTAEVKFELLDNTGRSASGWYTDKFKAAMDNLELIFPRNRSGYSVRYKYYDQNSELIDVIVIDEKNCNL